MSQFLLTEQPGVAAEWSSVVAEAGSRAPWLCAVWFASPYENDSLPLLHPLERVPGLLPYGRFEPFPFRPWQKNHAAAVFAEQCEAASQLADIVLRASETKLSKLTGY
jgi:hypothetical protein